LRRRAGGRILILPVELRAVAGESLCFPAWAELARGSWLAAWLLLFELCAA
jgi:hypothetical protein